MEIWKTIKGYEGLYEISDTGHVRSLDKIVIYTNGRKHFYKGKLIAPALHNGYFSVTLHKNGIKKTVKIHRLVAEAFVNNPNELPYVNHIDENKINNSASNLEWCTPKYNTNYGNAPRKRIESIKKPIYQLDIYGRFIKLWNSPTDVENTLGIKRTSISDCIASRSKTAGGFKWKYK